MAKFVLPKLDYNYDALEPYFDAQTMELHHAKHHQGYVDKLNEALAGDAKLGQKPVEELIAKLNSLPTAIRTPVQNFGGGHLNHSMWWKMLAPPTNAKPSGQLLKMIDDSFGSFQNFQKQFGDTALKLFGSGWVWLCKDNDGLEIMPTPNQNSPLSMGHQPILGIDLWEHVYYLKYQNRRADYIVAFWHVVNWRQVEKNFTLST